MTTLREASRRDIYHVFAWRCNPKIYTWMRDQDGPLEWEDHVSWWESRPDDRTDWMICDGSRPVGVVSIASDGDVGIYLGDTSVWGQGLATEALEKAVERSPKDLTAEIHADNERSKNLFKRVGFQPTDYDGPWVLYEYP